MTSAANEKLDRIIEEYEDKLKETRRQIQAEMIKETYSIEVIWCPHCDEMIRKGEICNICNTVIESGLPACKKCDSEKIYHDEKEEYFCPFHEES